MDYYHIPIPTPEFEIDGKKAPHYTTPHYTTSHCTTAGHYMTVFVDRTEWNLEDLDYIPTEQLFSKNKKYKKMVNKILTLTDTANTE